MWVEVRYMTPEQGLDFRVLGEYRCAECRQGMLGF
jgi:hypothetical protein